MTPEQADYYSGAMLERSLGTVIEILSEATEAQWSASHTGGGCFWLVTYLTEDLWQGPYLALTGAEGPLAGDDTLADIEPDGWMLCEYDGRYDDHSPNDDGEYPMHGPYGTEEIPLRAREVLNAMRERLP